MESWIVDNRHKTCLQCPQVKECKAALFIFTENSPCPLSKHPTRAEEIAERAWPSGVDRISGCCDPLG